MIMNIMIINKVQKFIAHKKKKKNPETDEDSYEETEQNEPEQKITNVFMEALRMAKEKEKEKREMKASEIDNGDLSSDPNRYNNDYMSHGESKGFNNSEEESIGNLIPRNQAKTERALNNMKLINKVVPTTQEINIERHDSKSTVKSSGQGSNVGINDDMIFDFNPQSSKVLKRSHKTQIEPMLNSTIITEFGNVDETKNYTVLNELQMGDYFGEISALK